MMLRNTPATVVAMIMLMIMPESSVESSVVSLTESLKIRKNYSYFHQRTQNVKTTKLTRNYTNYTYIMCVYVYITTDGTVSAFWASSV
jgi:hypothetical protein